MRQAQRALEFARKRKARADRTAQDMLHIDALARLDQRAIKDGVDDIVLRGIAIVQVEVIRADALAPSGQRKAEITRFAR